MLADSVLLLGLTLLVGCGDKEGGEDTAPADVDADGWVAGEDCDDLDPAVHPGAPEICDGVDNDCDRMVDDADDSLDLATAATGWLDADGDGYGDAGAEVQACSLPLGAVSDATDCDDADPAVSPGATELCDEVDVDCDGLAYLPGTASWQPEGGALADLGDALLGAEGAPAHLALGEAGTLRLCEGSWSATLDLSADVEIIGLAGEDGEVVLDAEGAGSVVQVSGEGLAVHLADLTLTGGVGELSELLGEGEGGGLLCESTGAPTALVLDRVRLEGNAGIFGGGLFTRGCDTTLSDSRLADNRAEAMAGAGWLVDGSHAWSGVEVVGNRSDGDIGGLHFSEHIDGLEVTLDGVEVRDNSASAGAGGGVAFQGGTVTWTGSVDAPSAATGNSAASEGGALWLSRTALTVDGVDLGAEASADDNLPHDLWVDSASAAYAAGDGASFSCDEDGCGRVVIHEVGGTDQSWTAGDGVLVADTILAERAATLVGFRMRGAASAGCEVEPVVLSADDPVAGAAVAWTVEWAGSARSWSETLAWQELGEPGLVTATGRTYAVGLVCRCEGAGACSLAGDADMPTTSLDAGFGQGSGMIYEEAFDGSTATPLGAEYGPLLGLRVDVVEL